MTLLRAEETAPGHAQIEVGLLYANDADVAEEATVTVTFTGPDGSMVGPVPAPRTTGARYVADTDLPAPGPWAFTVTAEAPAASVTGTVDMAPPAPPTTAAVPESTPAPAGTILVPAAGSSGPPAADDGPGPAPAVLAGAAVLAAAAVVGAGLARNRRKRAPGQADA
jgi:hypothetical protein